MQGRASPRSAGRRTPRGRKLRSKGKKKKKTTRAGSRSPRGDGGGGGLQQRGGGGGGRAAAATIGVPKLLDASDVSSGTVGRAPALAAAGRGPQYGAAPRPGVA